MQQHPHLDLTRPTEATRRTVYDRVAELVWTPAPQDEHRRTDTPDEAGLFVFHVWGDGSRSGRTTTSRTCRSTYASRSSAFKTIPAHAMASSSRRSSHGPAHVALRSGDEVQRPRHL